MILRHVEADHRLFVVEEKLGQRAAKFGFADAGRTEKDKRADRPILILQAGAGAAHGVGHGDDRVLLADDAELKPVFHLEQLLHLAFEHLGDRNAGPFGDDFGDVFGVDFFLEHLLIFLQFGEFLIGRFQLLSAVGVKRAVAQLGGLVEIAFALRLLFFDFGRFDLFFERADALDRLLFILPVGFEAARKSPSDCEFPVRAAPSRSFDALSSSRLSACRSISSCMILRSTSSISMGMLSISMRRREAASSIKSIALSGRKRSLM